MTYVHQHLEEVDSTNHALWELSEKIQLTDFHTISADYQWSGKGQDQNSWHSEKAKNILFSTLLFPKFLKAAEAFQMSRWVSVSILEYLLSKGIEEVSIKWPNDIYVADKKIAGILIQNAISGSSLDKSLVGIGLNLNEEIFPSGLPNPVSVKNLTGIDYSVLEDMYDLLSILKRNFELLNKSPQKIMSSYLNNLFRLNEWAGYIIHNIEYEARIIGVDEFGRLLLENRNGIVSQFDLKEIKFVL